MPRLFSPAENRERQSGSALYPTGFPGTTTSTPTTARPQCKATLSRWSSGRTAHEFSITAICTLAQCEQEEEIVDGARAGK